MSELAPPKLSSLIPDTPVDSGSSTQPQKPVSMPSLNKMVESLVSNPVVPVGQGSAGSASPAGETPAPSAEQVATDAQQQSVMRAMLSARGFNIPEDFSTDDQIADAIAQQFDSVSAVEQSQEYRTFLEKQADFQNYLKSQSAPPAAKPPEAPAAPEVSDSQLVNAMSSGFVTFDNTAKAWSPTHPQFANHAAALNARDSRVAETKISLASDPEGFIAAKIKEAISAIKPQDEAAELKAELAALRAERESVQKQQIDTWIDQNRGQLWVNDKPTPLHDLYVQFESALDIKNPLERHNEVLKRINIARQAFNPPPAAPPAAPVQVVAPKPSFMQNAAQRNGTNRLSEYQGAATNAVSPQAPRGPGGLPSLSGLIDQKSSLATH